MTRPALYALTAAAVLAAWHYSDVSRVAMRSAGNALVMVGYFLIGSAG